MNGITPHIIGITGGIGSGKSYVCRLLRQMDVPVYDCDSEAKRLINESQDIRQALKTIAGEDIYDGNGLVRERLAKYLFASQENAQHVNAIVHPAVLSDFRQWTTRQGSPVVGIESAILYESGFSHTVDAVLFVDASEATRLKRAMQRDGATEAQVTARMRQQQTDTGRKCADYIIHNDGATDAELITKIKEILERLESRLRLST